MATSSSDGPIKISKRVEKELHQTKVVIRRLPPDFTEQKLLEIFLDIPPYSFFYFCSGDASLGNLAFSRAYFAFTDEATILPFRDKYDGLHLESEKGAKYRAVVEFAPYQGVPKRQKRKPDARMGTIEEDSDYKAFLETSEVKTTPPTMAELSAYVDTIGTSKVTEVQKTPLISYLLDRRGSRSGKRSKSGGGESKKKHGRESSKSAKESRKDTGATGSSGGGGKGSKEPKSKGEGREGGREQTEKTKEEAPASVGSKDRPISSESQRKERGLREKRGQPRSKENGEVARAEGEKKPTRIKNKDRPDQALYSPRSKQQAQDRDRNPSKDSGKPKDRDAPPRQSSSSDYSRSGRSRGREYGDDRPRRNRGGWDDYSGGDRKEKRHEGGGGGRRGDSYRKSRDAHYANDEEKTHSLGYREK